MIELYNLFSTNFFLYLIFKHKLKFIILTYVHTQKKRFIYIAIKHLLKISLDELFLDLIYYYYFIIYYFFYILLFYLLYY